MVNKIILSAETELQDKELREWVSKLYTQIQTLNERTKRQTLDIKKIEKEISKINRNIYK